ncbi:MAG: portal protein [Candidatus Limnocylindrus sp.]
MRTRLRVAMSAYADSRQDQLDDLRFMAGSPDNNWQWPADVLKTRGSAQGQTINARPCLTINKLPQHVKQVTNDQRQNRPSGKVIPVDDMADVEMAEVLDGIVRHIEYISDADVAYDTACENQVIHGEGYIRLLTEYCDETSFDQDIKIGRVRNPFSVYMDPMIQDPCGADAEYCFITDEITKEEYHRLYPKAAPVTSIMAQGVGDADLTQWVGEMTIRIAEYFYYEHKPATLNLYPNGQVFFQDDPQDKQMRQMGLRPTRQRKVDRKQVKWIKTNGFEVLEERDWPGQYIPVVRVVGNEFEVDGEVQISGLVRNAKDAQRLYNYWVSQEAEMLALAPKAPFIGYGGQFEGYEHQWKTANVNNWPYLEVNPDATDGQGAPLPLPQRSTPPMAQTGLIQAKMGASDDLKATTGQYDPSLGATSNERSGRAILARQQQSNTGTFHYVDNLARAIRYITRQIIDLVPKIYDTRRIARIIGIDGEVTQAEIDPSQQQAVTKLIDEQGIVIKKLYNPSIGKYDVKVTTGPSYMTKRQESMEAMGQILQGNPQLWMAAGDLFVKNMDWPGAQELAARLRKMIDPKLLQDEDDPAIQAANQQIEALNGQIQQMMGLLQNVNQSMEAQDLAIKAQANDIKAYDAETKRLQAMSAAMTPEQVQEVVIQTLRDVMDLGNLAPMPQNFMPEQQPPMMPPEGVPQ